MPHEIFRDQITARLLRLNESSPATTIILVPSVRDIISRHMAFPQAMFDRETLGLPKVSPPKLQEVNVTLTNSEFDFSPTHAHFRSTKS
jgi:hypothetical protein